MIMNSRSVALMLLASSTLTPDRVACALEDRTIVIEHANVISMTKHEVDVDHMVLIRDGVIEAVGDSVVAPADALVIDADGAYLIPGLTDGHVHVLDEHDFELMLAHGVTSALNMSGSPLHLQWRDELRQGRRTGPTLYTTGPMLKLEGEPAVDFEVSVPDAATATAIVAANARAGYDFVKIWGAFSPEIYDAIASAAERHGIRLLGHIPRQVGLAKTLDAGQDAIAHVEEFFNKFFMRQIDDRQLPEAVRLTAEAGVPVITTLVTYEAIVGAAAEDMTPLLSRPERALLDPVRQLLWEGQFNRYHQGSHLGRDDFYRDALAFKQSIAKSLHEGGVKLIAGSDSGELPGLVPASDLHRELELLVDAGLSPHDALQAATANPGAFLGGAESFGTIAPGQRADLVLLDRNPLEDISNTRGIRGVMVRGAWHDRDDLDRILATRQARNDATGRFMKIVFGEGLSAAQAHYEAVRQDDADICVFTEMPVCFLAYMSAEGGDMATAAGLLQLVIREYPESYRAYYMLGGAMLAAGDAAQARVMFHRVLELAPSHAMATHLLEMASGSP